MNEESSIQGTPSPKPQAPSPPRRRYRGPRFLLTFSVVLILILVVGMWLTWTLAGIMTPALKAKQDERLRKDKADRARAREQEQNDKATKTILESRNPGLGTTG